ncbi:hypothetical protein N7495_005675 [Penicillium taxi]|uniref:uncharacterized protein n=1 Tax=Penicillium taxi TaxID=168475 RepID=UPI002544DF3B|nr:uncharacterized protein N7495_005675 [Penicillium taxi]KAJ5893984.1 hypothetical protein N7495_005675 [Penicillium taxi]
MLFYQIPLLLVTGGAFASAATSSSSASSSSSTKCPLAKEDTKVLEYTYALSNFVNSFYASVPLNQSVAAAASNSTSSSKALANIEGIASSNNLTIKAIRELSSQAPGFNAPNCSYTYPNVTGISSFIGYAYEFESTLSGAFIGAAGYTKSPQVAFLLARLAAEHSAHATWIGSRVNSTIFPANATSLVAAYNPDQVLNATTNATGSLGQYLGDCVSAPRNPCGVLKIGPLEANITSSTVAGSSSTRFGSSSTALSSSRRL